MSLKMGHATIQQVEANDVRSTTLTGTAIDIKDYVGDIAFIQHSDATNGADVTLNGKIQNSADGSTGWADITGATFTEVDNTAGGAFESIIVKADAVARYVRYVGTIAGTTPSFAFGVGMAGYKQER